MDPNGIIAFRRFLVLAVITLFIAIVSSTCENRKNRTTHIALLVAIVVGVLLYLGEIIINNPNEWTLMKCSILICVWSFILGNGSDVDSNEIITPKPKLFYVIASASFLLFIGGLIWGITTWGLRPITHIDHETTDITFLVAAGDAYQIKGGGALTMFAISENGVYRYYYIDEETHYKRQESVPAERAEIDDTYTGAPYLETYIEYDLWYGRYNRQLLPHKGLEETHYVFHVPPGSISESYQFDLQ